MTDTLRKNIERSKGEAFPIRILASFIQPLSTIRI
jgi:hypothetical protein